MEDPDRTSRLSSLLEALAGFKQLDVTACALELATRLGPPVRFGAARGRLKRAFPREVRIQSVSAWTLDPELLLTGMGLRWLSGPAASRPSVLLGVGLLPAGYVAAGLGRALDVPSVVWVSREDRDALDSRRGRRALRWSQLRAADHEEVADALARQGMDAILEPAMGPEAVWSGLGRRVAEAIVRGRPEGQGCRTSTSSV